MRFTLMTMGWLHMNSFSSDKPQPQTSRYIPFHANELFPLNNLTSNLDQNMTKMCEIRHSQHTVWQFREQQHNDIDLCINRYCPPPPRISAIPTLSKPHE